jgi:hypothetical protein
MVFCTLSMQASAMVRRITNDFRSATTVQELEAVVSEWHTHSFFDSIHTAAAFTRAANLLKGRPAPVIAAAQPLLDQLAATWETQLPQATVQGLANVLWASGRLRYANQQLWSRTLPLFCQRQQGEATCQEISNAVYAMAVLAAANGGEVPGLSKEDVAEALATLTQQVAVMVTAPAHSVAGQDISNVLWAHARLGVQVPAAWQRALLQSMACESILADATSQALVNVLYAVVHLQQLPGWQPAVSAQVWSRLLSPQQLQKITDTDKPQGVANALGALADMADAGQPITAAQAKAAAVQLLQGSVVNQMQKWNALDVRDSAAACTRLGLREPQFVAALLRRSLQLVTGQQQQQQQQRGQARSGSRPLGAAQSRELAEVMAAAVAALELPQLSKDAEKLALAVKAS